MKERCCANTPVRKIARSVYQAARDVACNIAKTSAYRQSWCDRKKVEMLFAHLRAANKTRMARRAGVDSTSVRQAGATTLAGFC